MNFAPNLTAEQVRNMAEDSVQRGQLVRAAAAFLSAPRWATCDALLRLGNCTSWVGGAFGSHPDGLVSYPRGERGNRGAQMSCCSRATSFMSILNSTSAAAKTTSVVAWPKSLSSVKISMPLSPHPALLSQASGNRSTTGGRSLRGRNNFVQCSARRERIPIPTTVPNSIRIGID